MNRAFTLIEIMVSLVILSMIFLAFSSLTNSLTKTERSLASLSQEKLSRTKIVKTLYEDFLLAKEVFIKNYDSYAVLRLKTSNSLYDMETPYVTWYVSATENALCRMESPRPQKLPLDPAEAPYQFLSVTAKGCEKFQIIRSLKNDRFIVYIKLKGQEPIIFGFYLPKSVLASKGKN